MRLWLVLCLCIAALGLLGGCGGLVNTDKFISTAASVSEFKIAASRLAATKASLPDVKLFAQQMISDHEAAAEVLEEAAVKAGAGGPTAAMEEAQARELDELKSASGPGFDELYVEQQVEAHEK